MDDATRAAEIERLEERLVGSVLEGLGRCGPRARQTLANALEHARQTPNDETWLGILEEAARRLTAEEKEEERCDCL